MDHKQLLKDCFNEYTGSNNEVLDRLYDKDVIFEDPLTKVSGLPALKKYYQHAYASVKEIRFDFKQIHESGLTFTCEWDMTMSVKALNFGRKYTVRGASVITFSQESNKVIRHHDYVDIGEMVYEKLPILSRLVKAIKSRLS